MDIISYLWAGSGALNVERLQFDDVHTLVNALAFYSVVAWQLLALTYTLRQAAERFFFAKFGAAAFAKPLQD